MDEIEMDLEDIHSPEYIAMPVKTKTDDDPTTIYGRFLRPFAGWGSIRFFEGEKPLASIPLTYASITENGSIDDVRTLIDAIDRKDYGREVEFDGEGWFVTVVLREDGVEVVSEDRDPARQKIELDNNLLAELLAWGLQIYASEFATWDFEDDEGETDL